MRRRGSYRYTPKRRAAFKKAQAISARKRRGKKIALAGGLGVGVLAVGVGGAVIYGRKTVSGGPADVRKTVPRQAKPANVNVAKAVVSKPHVQAERVHVPFGRSKTMSAGDVVEFKMGRHAGMDMYQTREYGRVLSSDAHAAIVDVYGASGNDKVRRVINRSVTGHRIGRTGVSPNPAHLSDSNWQIMQLSMARVLIEDEKKKRDEKRYRR